MNVWSCSINVGCRLVDYLRLDNHRAVAEAIAAMVVQGAPAIAIAGAYGLALAIQEGRSK